MESLPGGPPAVNAGGHRPATPPPAGPPPLPPHPPFPPCPACGGEVMRYLAPDLREDELVCLDCWWAAPTPPAARGG